MESKATLKEKLDETTPTNPVGHEIQKIEDDEAAELGRKLIDPAILGAELVTQFQPPYGNGKMEDFVTAIDERIDEMKGDDLSLAVEMLASQAITLNALSTDLLSRSKNQRSFSNFKDMIQLGMKAQAQCRTTLEALIEMKNPRPLAFVRQANIAGGNQQVNNCKTMAPVPCAGETKIPRNELLESKNEVDQRLDFGTQESTVPQHPEVASVGQGQRPKI